MAHKNREEQTVRENMHEIIFGAHTFYGWLFDMALLVVIILSVISNSLETVAGVKDLWADGLFWASWVFTGLFIETNIQLLTFDYIRLPLYEVK